MRSKGRSKLLGQDSKGESRNPQKENDKFFGSELRGIEDKVSSSSASVSLSSDSENDFIIKPKIKVQF